MAVGLNAETEYVQRASIPGSGDAARLCDGGFKNTFAGVWLMRPSATSTAALTGDGSVIHCQAGARYVNLGFNNAGAVLADKQLTIIFNSGGGGGSSQNFAGYFGDDFLDEWVYFFVFDNATDGQTAGYILLSDLNTAVTLVRANDNATSQFTHTLSFANYNSGDAVLLGHYAYGRARFASGITLDDVKAWAASDAPDSDWGFWPLADNTDTGDDSGNSRDMTFNGTITSESSPSLGAPAPEVTDVDTDEIIYDGQTSVVITGTGFGASQDTGFVELWDDTGGTTKVAQTVTAWGDTSITITVERGALSLGTRYIVVTHDDDTETDPFAVTLNIVPPTMWIGRANIRLQ